MRKLFAAVAACAATLALAGPAIANQATDASTDSAAWPSKYTGAAMNAGSNEVAVEAITLY